jgi:tRNA(Ile)-lysidine synthase
MAMLAALLAVLERNTRFSLTCLHVEHGLRPTAESRGDAEFVRGFCKRTNTNCVVVSIPPGKVAFYAKSRGLGIEAAARHFRMKALFRHAGRLGSNTRILIAHTRDDMLETALMRVLRGSGPCGLAAMPASRGRILRPLLSMNRADILEYLAGKKIPWREDSTNADTSFLRNRIRLKLIPLLNESFPAWKKALASLAETQALASAFIKDEARRRVSWHLCGDAFATGAEVFFSQPEIIREEALFQGIDLRFAKRSFKKNEKNADTFKPRRSVIRRFCAKNVNTADLGLLRAENIEKRVIISACAKGPSENGFTLLIKEPGLYNLKNIGIEVRSLSAPNQQSGDRYFYAGLPLVFRRSCKDDFLISRGRKITRKDLAEAVISAADRMGTAAFIGGKTLLAGRDFSSGECETQKWFSVGITSK